jgi:site-specific recombinase XerD
MANAMSILQLWSAFDCGALVEGATKHKCRTAARKFAELVGDVVAESISPLQIQQYQVGMQDKGLSVASIRSYFGSMAQMYHWAVGLKILGLNPWSSATKIRPTHPEIQIYSESQSDRLIEAAARIGFRVPMADAQYCAGHRSMMTTRQFYIAVDQGRSVANVRAALK